ncbi:hypothetical protein B488_02520 [Liberibacter crescens BT-1]|uniref:Lipoprotein n=1 Tax=Liberibacter crescens (strain BT-1) TaxID=1215343 RepID=L0ETS5_LIBCB|nr:hypothetical protein [Liberibacter crescens]AGA64245.1 hypothetical protein B488_02520 [Liberibacter crescens BT-1]AMC12484.1 hypothetical protein RL73_01430 [Liberibacter crescens]
MTVRPLKRGGLFFILITQCTAFSISGCASSPTYGTGKNSTEQLAQDISHIASLSNHGPNSKGIKYVERPELITPNSKKKLLSKNKYQKTDILQKNSDTQKRQYLSDPPSQYTETSDDSKLKDTGISEDKKEKLRKKKSEMSQKNSIW